MHYQDPWNPSSQKVCLVSHQNILGRPGWTWGEGIDSDFVYRRPRNRRLNKPVFTTLQSPDWSLRREGFSVKDKRNNQEEHTISTSSYHHTDIFQKDEEPLRTNDRQWTSGCEETGTTWSSNCPNTSSRCIKLRTTGCTICIPFAMYIQGDTRCARID